MSVLHFLGLFRMKEVFKSKPLKFLKLLLFIKLLCKIYVVGCSGVNLSVIIESIFSCTGVVFFFFFLLIFVAQNKMIPLC